MKDIDAYQVRIGEQKLTDADEIFLYRMLVYFGNTIDTHGYASISFITDSRCY